MLKELVLHLLWNQIKYALGLNASNTAWLKTSLPPGAVLAPILWSRNPNTSYFIHGNIVTSYLQMRCWYESLILLWQDSFWFLRLQNFLKCTESDCFCHFIAKINSIFNIWKHFDVTEGFFLLYWEAHAAVPCLPVQILLDVVVLELIITRNYNLSQSSVRILPILFMFIED